MEQTAQGRIQALTNQLNRYRHEYYNLSAPSVSDQVYDSLFDELAALERQTGIVMGNSPTQTVGYPTVSALEKTTHTVPPPLSGQDQERGGRAEFCGRTAGAYHAQAGRPHAEIDLRKR